MSARGEACSHALTRDDLRSPDRETLRLVGDLRWRRGETLLVRADHLHRFWISHALAGRGPGSLPGILEG